MLNQVSLMGRLTADPEKRTTPNGISVTTFTIAVGRSYVSKGAERQTDFIDIVAWRSTADFICNYFKKGQMIAVTGSIQTRTYTDKEGKNRKAFEVVADNVYFTEGKSSNSGSSSSTNDYQNSYSQSSSSDNIYGSDNSASYSSGDANDFTLVEDDNDLPF